MLDLFLGSFYFTDPASIHFTNPNPPPRQGRGQFQSLFDSDDKKCWSKPTKKLRRWTTKDYMLHLIADVYHYDNKYEIT